MVQFTPGELEVMQILWEGGEMKPSEIQKVFPRPIKNPALRSYLSILVEKGHLTRRQNGKAFHYKAKTKRNSAFRSVIRDLAKTFCKGSTDALVARLIRDEKYSKKELRKLAKLAKEEDKDRRKK